MQEQLEELVYAVPDEDPPVEFRRGSDGRFYKREAVEGKFAEDGSDWQLLSSTEIRRYLSGNGALADWLRELVLPGDLEEEDEVEDRSQIDARRLLGQKL
ncbi:MAG: hypothetical protein RMM17_12440 [Acidobacteriota bacterium]|nr:hypothetical protein [Blastocatellia bacterium]MDW8413479.1 hypothetical protein [Acidobacteriota bacterium]